MRIILGIVFYLSIAQLTAQSTWSESIADIIYTRCASCHHTGGIAPFNLMSYEETVAYGEAIHHAIEERSMPPWPADPEYRHFLNEDLLTQDQIDAIHNWIEEDYPFGIEGLEPDPPEFHLSGSLLDRVDLVLQIEPYELQSNADEYRWFVVGNPFDHPIYIESMEVIPGLPSIVHHADFFLDNTGGSLANDLLDPLPGFNSSTGGPSYSKYVNAWAPGGGIVNYPDNWGFRVDPEDEMVFEVHYGPGGQGMVDSTKYLLKLYQDVSDVRELTAKWFLNTSADVFLDGPLYIPANEVVTFHQQSQPLTDTMSLVSIAPHMHFLGKSYKVWYETPEGDSIGLIDIPHWDFHWQKYYTYPSIEVIPEGSVIKSVGVYDNTLANHDNPNNPPIDVWEGTKTEDEMFLTYFLYSDYQPGDEFITLGDVEDPIANSTEIAIAQLHCYPNPATSTISFDLPEIVKEEAYLSIYDYQGKQFLYKSKLRVPHLDISHYPNGLYYVVLEAPGVTFSEKFVIDK